jgi:hypothetical protein
MTPRLLKLLILLALPCGQNAPPGRAQEFAQPFFTDGFESGDLSSKGERRGFGWGGGKGHFNASVRAGWAHTGEHSVQLTYRGSESGRGAIAQLAWTLDEAIDPGEIWIEYYIYFPDGTEGLGSAEYRMRYKSPSGGGKIIRVWGGEKAQGYDKGYKTGASFTTQQGFAGGSRLYFHHWLQEERTLVNVGRMQGLEGADGQPPGIIHRGEWLRFRWHFKTASGPGRPDASLRWWIGENLVARQLHMNGWRREEQGNENTFRAGYFMGNTNSGFDEETHVYLDDFRFYDQDPGW